MAERGLSVFVVLQVGWVDDSAEIIAGGRHWTYGAGGLELIERGRHDCVVVCMKVCGGTTADECMVRGVGVGCLEEAVE